MHSVSDSITLTEAWENRYGPGNLNSASDYPNVHRHVRNLQADLISLGYNLGTGGADGYYGPATKAAVRAFQEDNGLSVDGIAGPATKAKLYILTHES